MSMKLEKEFARIDDYLPSAKTDGYSAFAKVLQWLMAALVFLNTGLGWSIDGGDTPPGNPNVLLVHFALGILFIVLLTARVICRRRNSPPPLPETVSVHQQRAARLTHFSLYGLMTLVPMLGLWTSLSHQEVLPFLSGAGFEKPLSNASTFSSRKDLHVLSVNLLLTVGMIHVAAALHHQFWGKDKLLHRTAWGNQHEK